MSSLYENKYKNKLTACMKSYFTSKKGVLFTIVTIILLTSLFLFTKAFLDRSIELDNALVSYQNTEKLAYIEDDIVSNSYSDLLKISLSAIKRDPLYINITFNHLGILSPNLNHNKIMQDYKDFVVNNYSTMNNIAITLTDFTSNFTINPYNASYYLNGSKLYLYNPDYTSLQKISLQVKTNDDNLNFKNSSTPSNSSGKLIEVNIIDKDGDSLLPTTIRTLSPTLVNAPFYVNFNTTNTPNVSIYFGQFNNKNGTLFVSTDFTTANITSITLTYTALQQKVYLSAGNLTIANKLNAVNKTNEVILAEEWWKRYL